MNIGCTTNFVTYPFIFSCLQALTWGYIRELCLPSPCSESINFCWFQKILWWRGKILMTCHGIFCHIIWKLPYGKRVYQEYSMTCSHVHPLMLLCIFRFNFLGMKLTACSTIFEFFLGGTSSCVPLWIIQENIFWSKIIFFVPYFCT